MATLPSAPLTPRDAAPAAPTAVRPAEPAAAAGTPPGDDARLEPQRPLHDARAGEATASRPPARLVIRFDADSHRIIYEFRSVEDGSLLRQFPAEDLLKMVEQGKTTPGQLLDGKA